MNNNQEKIEEEKKSIWGFFIGKMPITILIIISITLFGISSYMGLNEELQPEIKLPYGSVMTILPGANPIDIESLITEKLEQEISNIDNIKTLSSDSSFSVSSIFIEFETNSDLDTDIQELKDAVDRAKNELPDDASDPMVIKAEANQYPIITFSITGEKDLGELTSIAEEIQPELEKITGVSQVDLIGGQKKEIEILIDQQKLNNYNLTIDQISSLLKYGNISLPIGTVQIDQQNYSIRIDNKFKDIESIREFPLITISGETPTQILLKDIAQIEEKYPDESTISKLSINGEKSMRSVSLRVSKKNDANVIDVAEKTKTKIDELVNNNFVPNDVKIVISNDNSVYIKEELDVLTTNGWQTIVLITIVLFLALGLIEGIITGITLPMGFFITFIIMKAMGLTLNGLSLFSLVIALGLMVDTAIVIMQGTYDFIKKGHNALDASYLSVNTYKWPLMAGSLTTVFAFFPMLLVSGIIGEFLKTLPIVISTTLIATLLVSFTIEPAIAGRLLNAEKIQNKKKENLLQPVFKALGNFLYNNSRKVLQNKASRIIVIVIVFIAFLGSVALPASGLLKAELFPKTDGDSFTINIETPKGTITEGTKLVAEEVEQYIYTIPEIENFLTVIGKSGESMELVSSGSSSDTNLANITVNLVSKDKRKRKSFEIADQIRNQFKNTDNAVLTITEVSEGPPSEDPVTIRITGPDLDKLKEISEKIKSELKNIPETQNIKDTFKKGLNEFVFTLDSNMLSYYGLSAIQVSASIRNVIQGIESTEIKLDGKDVKVNIRYDFLREYGKTITDINEIQNFEINTAKGQTITLSKIATFEIDESLQNIERENTKRIIKVKSGVTKNGNSVDISNTLQERLKDYEIPKGYEIKFGGDLEEIANSFNELYVSMSLAIILIGMTLVLMFNSFRQAFIVLLTMPLGIIGVFPGLFFSGMNFSFPAFLGLVALAGIVVNNAIILLDRINENRKEGMIFIDAITESSKSRLEPILLTTITTIIGILPLALTDEFWRGLGFTLIFGLITSTVLTLFVIPTIYFSLEVKKAKKKGETIFN